MTETFLPQDRRLLAALAPLAERALSIDAQVDLRLRAGTGRLSGFVRLPFDVIVGCTVAAPDTDAFDVTVAAADYVRWCAGPGIELPRRDANWLSALPPQRGWQRIEVVPAAVVDNLVRAGAALAPKAGTRGAQQSLLGSTVLTATSGDKQVAVPLSVLSALVRMSFMTPEGAAAIDVGPGWLRVAAPHGSAYQRNSGAALDVLGMAR